MSFHASHGRYSERNLLRTSGLYETGSSSLAASAAAAQISAASPPRARAHLSGSSEAAQLATAGAALGNETDRDTACQRTPGSTVITKHMYLSLSHHTGSQAPGKVTKSGFSPEVKGIAWLETTSLSDPGSGTPDV